MSTILISRRALDGIHTECERYGEHSETGGILVGPRTHKNVITDIIPSSSHAERRSMTYSQTSQDVEILNRQLKFFQEQGIDYRGDFHRHPAGLSCLSDGDIQTCGQILASPNYKIDNYLIMGIAARLPQEPLATFFYVVSILNNSIQVREVRYQVVPTIALINRFSTRHATSKPHEVQNERPYPRHTLLVPERNKQNPSVRIQD